MKQSQKSLYDAKALISEYQHQNARRPTVQTQRAKSVVCRSCRRCVHLSKLSRSCATCNMKAVIIRNSENLSRSSVGNWQDSARFEHGSSILMANCRPMETRVPPTISHNPVPSSSFKHLLAFKHLRHLTVFAKP